MTNDIEILTACESERHLSEPIYNELKKLGLNPSYIHLKQNDVQQSYCNTDFIIRNFDFVLAVGDRIEQIGGVLAAFQNKIPVGHLYSGDLDTGVSDDIHRAAITLYSSIQFCSSKSAVINTKKIMLNAGLTPNTHFVGATHFDGLNIEEIKGTVHKGLVKDKPYILILINQEILSKPEYGDSDILAEKAAAEAIKLSTDNLYNFIIAKGNNDDEEIETKIFNKLNRYTDGNIHIERNNRTDHYFFLSMTANCNYFITNSSSAIYEAPVLINSERIIHIGNRNRNRTPVPASSHDGHASERVAKLIKEYLETKK